MIATGLRLLPLVAALALATPARAAESIDACLGFIDTLPAVITTPGTYCLRTYLFSENWSGAAFRIEADDVTLDCNGFHIRSQADPDNQAIGIQVVNRHDVTIRRCTVLNYRTGLLIDRTGSGVSERHLVEDNVIYGSVQTGMRVIGNETVIRRNRVLETGIGVPDLSGPEGIHAEGSIDLLDNTVSGVEGDSDYGGVWGICALYNPGGSIRGNRVRGLRDRRTGIPLAIGVHDVNGLSRVTLRNNVLSGNGKGWGLNCQSQNQSFQPDVHARGNSIVGFATPNQGCVDDGNVVRP